MRSRDNHTLHIRLAIVEELVAMRRRGELGGVWCDNMCLRIARPVLEPCALQPRPTTWQQAGRITGVTQAARKPMRWQDRRAAYMEAKRG